MRIVEQVPGLGDRRERHADRFQLGGELALRVLARELVEARDEPGALLHPLAVGLEARIGGELVEPEFAAERVPLSVGHHADEEASAARGLEDVVDAPGRPLDRHRRRRLAGELELRHVLGDEVGSALEERARHLHAAAGRLALAQRGQDADRGEGAAHDVDHRGARAQRPVGQAGHVREAAHHLRHLVERRAVLVGAVQEALQRAVDEARVVALAAGRRKSRACRARRGGSSPSAHRPCSRSCSTNSRPSGCCRSTARLFLLRLNTGKKPDPACSRRRVLSPFERLDLDDFGAEVGEHQAAGGAHHHVRELDHPHAFERKHP